MTSFIILDGFLDDFRRVIKIYKLCTFQAQLRASVFLALEEQDAVQVKKGFDLTIQSL
mgnify:FL=1